MIRAWLDMPTAGIFLSLGLIYFGMVVALVVLAFRARTKKPIHTIHGVVDAFFNSVAILFALLTGFLANDVSERGRQAVRTVQAEAGELRNIHTLSVASVSDMQSIRTALNAYVSSLVADEWPAMNAAKPSHRTAAAFDNLLREVSQPGLTKASGQVVHSALMNATVRAGTLRNTRLALASDHTDEAKWLVVIMLGLITQVGIGLVHLGRPRAFAVTLTIFTTAAVIALGFIALQEYPFSGTLRVPPTPIVTVGALGN